MCAAMDTAAIEIIDALGGTTKLAKALEAPTSTVFSWRKIGIPPSRMAHIRLIAQVQGVELPAHAQGDRNEAAA